MHSESTVRNTKKGNALSHLKSKTTVFAICSIAVTALLFTNPFNLQKENSSSLVESTQNKTVVSTDTYVASSTAAAMMMPTEVTECQTVSSCEGDAEQWANGGNLQICGDPAVTDLDLGVQGRNANVTAMNWGGWTIPAGATITDAYIQFTASSNSVGSAAYTVYGEAADNPPLFSTTDDVVSRTATSSSVSWTPGTWTAGDSGTAQKTPDLTAIIQEIVDRPGYATGNNIVLAIDGKGSRQAVDYGNDPAAAPELCITYEIPAEPSVYCTECPGMTIASLDGVPNYPSVDELNVCSTPDTVSLILYNNGECPMNNVQVTINFDTGLAYGGFVEAHNGMGTVGEFDVTDGSNPVFLINTIDSAGIFILNFGMTADCDIDLESETDINFDVVVDFEYDLEAGGVGTCSENITEVGSYGNGIKVPVLNNLSITPEEQSIMTSATPECQTLVISQDGLESKLSDFVLEINGIDYANYSLESVSINGIDATGTLTMDMTNGTAEVVIDGQYFGPNYGPGANSDDIFDVNEDLDIEVCWGVEGCTEEAMFLSYEVYYGCNGKQCGDRSIKEGSIDFTPNFGSTVVASSANIMYGGICGTPMSYDITVMSANTDPMDGLWQDLILKYAACLGNGMTVGSVSVNGTELDASLWSITGSTLELDFSTNTNPAYGLQDLDGGGVMNDLAGGDALTISTVIEIGCSDSMSSCDGDLGCNLSAIEVNGKRNCGQDFQQFGSFTPTVNFFYGEISSTDNTMIIPGYGLPITEVISTTANVWGPGTVGFEYGYEFGFENIEPCANPGGVYLVANIVAAGDRIKHIRYEDGSATYQGMPIAGTTAEYETVDIGGGMLDTIGLNITIPAGDPNASIHDYFFNLEYEGFCAPADYAYLTYKVVEECNGCGDVDPCEIVRSCGDAAVYVIWRGVSCPCIMEGETGEYYRTNYGFADKEMTQQLTRDDVPRADQIRLLPGDTLFRSTEFTINDIDEFKKADQQWLMRFDMNTPSPATPLIGDINNAQFLGWFWYDESTDTRVEIGVPDCMQNYTHSSRDNYIYPSIQLENFGVEGYGLNYGQAAPGGADNNYGFCEDDPNLNPTYPGNIVHYDMQNTSTTDYFTDHSRMTVFWQRPANCGFTGSSVTTRDGLPSQDHVNPCFEEFFQQFPMDNGDKIIVEYQVPMIHNPAFDLQAINGTSFPSAPNLYIDFIGYSWDENSCSSTTIFSDCSQSAPIQEHLPGPVAVSNNVTVADCDTEVEYTFTLENPVPTDLADGELPWFENEYRPYFATEYLQFQFPNNMVYLGDGVIVMPDGSEVTFPPDYIRDEEGNLACIDDNGNTCCVAESTDTLAALKLVDEQYLEGISTPYGYGPDGPNETGDYCDIPQLIHKKGDPFPHLMVGGTEQCTYGVRYSLSSLCPEDIESTDFRLEYQFAEPYIPTLARERQNSYFGNASTATRDYTNTSYRYMFPINPFGEGCSADPLEGCSSYFQKITTDPNASNHTVNPMRQGGYLITSPENFTDNSSNFPPLLPNLSELLIADVAGGNETNVYEVCSEMNGVDMGTHTNVVTSVVVPSSIAFIDAVDPATGMSLPWTLVTQLPESNAYAITMPDLAPGECAEVELVTELLFCPVGLDVETQICLTTTSGCIDPNKAALFSAAGGACDEVGACYEYVAEEAEIQAEWNPNPIGEYPLCETIPMGTVIKNVKLATMTGIGTDWWFPSGIDYVPGSWQVCYPGGPSFTAPCVSIPDPTADPASNSALGRNFEYTDDAIWSGVLPNDPINSDGLPGVASAMDSNFVQFLFEVETVCDEFVSGTQIYFQASGNDPCESIFNTMFVPSNPIIIEGANPADFPQFFVFADPMEANCGVETTLNLTYLNTSPLGETENSMVCMDIETSTFAYVPGSVAWVSPGSHTPTFTETMNGSITHICFDIPDGIGPGQAFQTSFTFTVPEDIECGDQDLGVQVSSEIMNANCMAQGIECSVDVLNSVNPIIELNFLPPVTVEDQNLTVGCGNGDGTVPLCYTAELLNNGDFYQNDIEIAIIRDIDANGQIDDYDEKLVSEMQSVTMTNGSTTILEGCFDIDENLACPVFLMIMQETNCVCDAQDFYYDSIEPDVVDALGNEFALCPMTPFGLENCGDWDYVVTPAAGGTLAENAAGDSLYLTLNEGYGIDSPVVLSVTSQTGGCQPFTFDIELYSLAEFMPGPYDLVEACSVGCTQLDLDIPSEYENSVTVMWSPTDYLDDPTSFTPTMCDPAASITYEVTFFFMTDGGMCEFTGFYPVEVLEQPVSALFDQGSLCNAATATFTAPTGFTNYNWIKVNADGTETPVQVGANGTFEATEEGTYYLEYYNVGDVCNSASEQFTVINCPTFEKTISNITPTANANEYNVFYEITVENTSAFPTEYDLYDEPGFDTDIVIINASYTSDATPSGGLVLPVPATPGWQLADDEPLAANSTHTYTVTYLVQMDLLEQNGPTPGDGMYTQCGQGSGPDNAGPGEALYNNAALDLDNDGTPDAEDSDCGELPYLVLDKATDTIIPLGDNCYDIIYLLTVENIGGATGTYDLTDDPGFDDDFVITAADYTTTAVGNPGSSLAANNQGWILANNQDIEPGIVDSFTLTVTTCIDLEDGAVGDDTYNAACGSTNGGDPTAGEGLFNQAGLDVNDDGVVDQTDEACEDVPYLIVTKTFTSMNVLPDGSADVVFTIEVENIGAIDTIYDLFDFPEYDDDIIINSVAYSSDVPSMGTLPTTPPATPGWVLATDEPIAAGVLHTYTMTVNASVDTNDGVGDDSYSACGANGSGAAAPGEGLFNTASIDYVGDDTVEAQDTACADVIIVDAALAKTVVTSGPFAYGDIVEFQIEVFNQSNIPIQNVLVTDYPGCGYVYSSGSQMWDPAGDYYTTTVEGPIAPDESEIVTISYEVVPCTTMDNAYLNVAEISYMENEDGEDISGDDVDSTPDGDPTNDGGGVVDGDSDNVVDGDGSADPGTDDAAGDEDDADPAQIEIFDLALTKVLDTPPPYAYGDELTFTIEVTNQGNVTATDILITDYIPSGYTYVSGMPAWTPAGDHYEATIPGPLAPGASMPITITLELVMDNSDGTSSYINEAEITSASDEEGNVTEDIDSTPDDDPANDAGGAVDTDSDDVIDGDASGDPDDEVAGTDEDDADPAGIFIVDVALTKVPVTAGPFTYDDVVEFEVEVYNQGSVTLTDVVVTDYLPCGYEFDASSAPTWSYDSAAHTATTTVAGPIAPGATETVSIFVVVVPCSDATGGAYTNTAEVTSMSDDEGNDVTGDDIDSTADDDPTNDGGGVPEGDTDDTVDGDGSGTPGDDTASGDEDDADPAIIDVFDLALIKTVADPGPYAWLDDITYDITVTNQGNVEADNIEITDYFPSCFTLNDAAWTDNMNSTATRTLTVANGGLTAPLAPAESVTVQITLTVGACGTQTQVNYAEISDATDGDGAPQTDADSTPDDTNGNDAGGNPDTDSDDVVDGDGSGTPNDEVAETDEDDHDPEPVLVEVPIWDLALVKTLTLGQPNPVAVGDLVSFDIQVTNQGNQPADNIMITDQLPDCLTLTDSDWSDNGDGTADITLSVANGGLAVPLPPGQSVLVDIVFTVDACASGTLMNWAEISDFTDEFGDPQEDDDSTPDSDPDNDLFTSDDDITQDGLNGGDEDDHDPADITILDPENMVFDLALTKTLSPGQASTVGNGATVSFDITVINQGNLSADNIEVVDYMPDCFMLADMDWTDNGDGTASITLSVANGGLSTPLQPNTQVIVPITVVLMDCAPGDLTNYAEIAGATDSQGNPQDDTDSTPDSDPNNDTEGEDNQTDGDGTDDEDDHDPETITLDDTIPMDFDLALTKVLAPGQVVPVENGDMVNFEIEVFNQGDLTADNIEVVDYIPSCMSLADTDWTDNGNGSASITLSVANGGLDTPLLPGTSVKVEITLSVDACTSGTSVTNWSEIAGATDGAGNPQTDVDSTPDSDPDNDEYMTDNDTTGDGTNDEDDHDPAEVPIGTPEPEEFDLALVKSLAFGQSSTVMPGDLVDYEIFVINQGNVPADNVELVDYIPDCFTLADNDWTDNGDGTASIMVSVANGGLTTPILPGESVAVPLTLEVGACSGTSQTNWAEIAGATDGNGNPQTDVDSTPDSDPNNDNYGEDDQTDGDGIDDEDDHDPEVVTVQDEIEEFFDLALTKTVLPGASNTIPLNTGVTFNINVQNQGTIAADNIEVIDYLPECATLEDVNWTDNLDGTASITLSVANGGLSFPLPPGETVTVPITLDYSDCPTGSHTNWAEIVDATDGNGDPVTDVDSTPDDDQDNDTYGDNDQTDGDGTDDEDDHDPEEIIISPVVDPVFDLALEKRLAPGQSSNVANGDIVVYEITVYNQGNIPADDIEVVDYLPSCQTLVDPNWFYDAGDNTAVRIVSVANGDMAAPLAPGQAVSVTIAMMLDGCAMGPIVNWAEIGSATDSNGNPVTDIDSTPDEDPDNDVYGDDNQLDGDGTDDEDDHDPEQIQIMDPADVPSDFDLALIKIIVPGQLGVFSEGDDVSFRIQVTNQGNVPADNIEIIDYLPECTTLNDPDWTDNGDGTASILLSVANGGLTGLLTPNQSVTVDITIQLGDCPGGEHINWAEISGGTDGAGNPGDDVDSTPDTDPDNDPFDTDNDNTGDGTADEDDHDPELFLVEEVFDLALSKEVTSMGPYAIGDDVTFGINVYNQGNITANNIEVVDYTPAGYSFDPAANAGWTEDVDGTLRYTHTMDLAPNTSVTIPLVLTIQPTSGGANDWTNYAEIAGATDDEGNPRDDVDSNPDDFPDNDNDVQPGDDNDGVVDEDPTQPGQDDEDDHDPAMVEVFDLAQIKQLVTAGPYVYGDVLTYEITVTNQGNVPATNVVINESLPCGLTYLASNDGSWTYDAASHTAQTTITTLINPGFTSVVTIDLELTQCLGDDDGFENISEISSATDDEGNPREDSDGTFDDDPDDETDVTDNEENGNPDDPNNPDEDNHDPETLPVFDLAQIKTLVTPGPYSYGDLLEFEVTVCNQGNVDAFNIEVTDYIPAGYSFDAAASTGWTFTDPDATYQIDNLAADDCVTVSLFMTIEMTTGGEEDWINYTEITSADDDMDPNNTPPVDADSTPGSDTAEENDIQPDGLGDDDLDTVDPNGNQDDHDPAGIEIFDLAQFKQAVTPGPYVYGDMIDYQLTVTNQGSVAAYNVVLADHLPCGLLYMGVNDANGWSYDGSAASITIPGPLAPGETMTRTLTVQVFDCYDDGAFYNVSEISSSDDNQDPNDTPPVDIDSDADNDPNNDGDPTDDEVNGDPNDPNNPDEDDHDPEEIEVFDLALRKLSTFMGVDSIGPFVPGDIVEFHIDVVNQGNVDAYNTEVTDWLNAGFLFDAALNPGWTNTGGLLTHDIDFLAAGDTTQLVLNLEIYIDDNSEFGDWYNEAEISYSEDENGNNTGDGSLVDADSTPDQDPDNDNDLVDGGDEDPVFNGDDNDNELDENPNDPFGEGDDDEDDNDAAEVLVTGEIGDTVWKDLNGDGVQDVGEPGLEGVVVSLYDCAGNLLETTTTDATGYYLFDLLLPGGYQINFDISGLGDDCAFTPQDQGTDDELDSDANIQGWTGCIDLMAGEMNHSVDAGVLPLAKLGDIVWLDCNGNGVQDGGETGIEGIEVEVYNSLGNLVATTFTDASGAYLVDKLYPGQYYVKFNKGKYEAISPNQGGNNALDSDVTDANGDCTTDLITLGAGECNLDDFDAGLYECVQIGELVWLDYNENDLWDPTENGINGLKVELYRFMNGAWTFYDYEYTGHKPGTPSDDGYFKFCVPPGRYYLAFKNPPATLVPAVANFGIMESLDSDVTGMFGSGTTDEIVLRCGEDRCDIGAGFYRMGSIGDHVWMDNNGNGMRESNEPGLANVIVRAIDLYGEELGKATTNQDGEYMIDYLGKNSYYLKFDLPNGYGITTPNMGADEAMDSDVDGSNGPMTTAYYSVLPGTHVPNIDAGVVTSVLSAEWLDIKAENQGNFNEVTWTVQKEENASHYEVERSINATDDFEVIGKVLAENTGGTLYYSYDDYDVETAGVYYYRIRQLDLNDQALVSKIVSVDLSDRNGEKAEHKVQIYPNPVVDEMTLDLELGYDVADLNVNLFDAQGRIVRSNLIVDFDLATGKKLYKVNVKELAKGIYTIKVNLDRKQIVKKLIVIEQ